MPRYFTCLSRPAPWMQLANFHVLRATGLHTTVCGDHCDRLRRLRISGHSELEVGCSDRELSRSA
jgi:hypothetical protein